MNTLYSGSELAGGWGPEWAAIWTMSVCELYIGNRNTASS